MIKHFPAVVRRLLCVVGLTLSRAIGAAAAKARGTFAPGMARMRPTPIARSLAVVAFATISTAAFAQGAGWYYQMMQQCTAEHGRWECTNNGAYCHCVKPGQAVRPPQPQPAPVQPEQPALRSSPPLNSSPAWVGPYGNWAETQRKYNNAMDAAKAAYGRKDYEEALRLYRQAQAIRNTPDARYGIAASQAAPDVKKGDAAFDAGDYESAIRFYAEAVKLVADFQPYRDALARARAALAEEKRKAADAQQHAVDDTLFSLTRSIGAIHADIGGEGLPPALNQPPIRHYVPSGNGLIGGTTWIAGYYATKDASPALKAKERAMLKQLSKLAGDPDGYDEAVDFKRYNFVIGIAESTTAWRDVVNRVMFDELSNGKATSEMQAGYNSLRGRAFGELACHSNGAMICLAALENFEVKADRVVLYGPQITPESLGMWQHLIKTKQIKSVQIYLNQNDPVAWVSMMAGGDSALTGGVGLTARLLDAGAMKKRIQELAPSIAVKTFPCGTLASILTLKCHYLAAYKKDRNSASNAGAQ